MMTILRFARSDDGQAIVEVAILAPFLLAILLTIIDIGRLNHYQEIVGNSARAGVQYGSQNLTTAKDGPGMQLAAKNDAQNLAGLTVSGVPLCKCSDGSAAVCTPPTVCPAGEHILSYASVTSTYQFNTLFNYHVIPATIPLARTEIMQVAQ